MFSLLFVSLSWASPAAPIVLLQNILLHQETEDFLLKEQGMTKSIVLPTQSNAVADAIFKKPSFIGMLNRYGLGDDVVNDIATSKVAVFKAENSVSKWLWLTREEQPAFLMVSITRKEMYPITNPFSEIRNDVLFHSIRHIKATCKNFSGAIDGVVRKWEASECSFGNAWIEWNPTMEYSFRILIQFQPSKIE